MSQKEHQQIAKNNTSKSQKAPATSARLCNHSAIRPSILRGNPAPLPKMIDRPGSGQSRPRPGSLQSRARNPPQALARGSKKENESEPVNFRNLYNFGQLLRTKTGAAPPPKPPGPCRCGMSQPVGGAGALALIKLNLFQCSSFAAVTLAHPNLA